MKNAQLNEWLTLIANLCVIAGIAFFSVEIQQNNALLRAEARYAHFQNRAFYQETLMQKEWAELYVRATTNENLDAVDRLRMTSFYKRIYRGFLWEFGQSQDGHIDIPAHRWASLIRENSYALAARESTAKNLGNSPFVQFIEEKVLGRSRENS